jgi:ribosomal protein L35
MTPEEIRVEVRQRRADALAQYRAEAMNAQVAANRRYRATTMGRLLIKEANARHYKRRRLREAAGAGTVHGLANARNGPA